MIMFAVSTSAVLTTSISLPSSITIAEGDIVSINPTFYPSDATDKSYTIIGSDYSYSYKGGFIGIQNKTETCKFEDYVYVTNNNLIKGLKATIEELSDKEEKPTFSFRVTVKANDGSGIMATTTLKILPKMIDISYNGTEELPWYYGNSAKLSYKLHDSIADQYDDSSIRFKSSDTSIATVTSDGTVTCKGVGDVTITAYTTDGKYSGTYTFYSRGIIEIEDTFVENCKAGATYQIKASIKPSNTADTIIYYSSDPSIATVNNNGLVTFNVASGYTKILVGISSDNTTFKEVWFTTDTFKAPSGTTAQLLEHMKVTTNALKISNDIPGLTRYEATTLSKFTTADQSVATSLQSMFNSDLKPKKTYLAPAPSSLPLADYINQRNVFLDSVPVKGQSYVIEESLSANDISKIEIINSDSYFYEMKLTLNEEYFATLPSANSNNIHSKIFDILTQEHIDSALNKLNSSSQASMTFSAFTQRYHDCSLIVGINKVTNEIEYANYDMNIDIYVSDLTLKITGLSTKMDISFSCNNIINLDFSGNTTPLGSHSHSFTNYISDGTATCYSIGYKTAKCDLCNATDTIPEIAAHNFDLYLLAKHPSCTEDGEMAYFCKWCELKNENSVVKLEKLPHNFKNGWQAITLPTCINTGVSIRICNDCLITESKIENATGHTFSGSVCTDCGYDKANDCSCNCHKTGLFAIIWKIINIFNKLLKKNPVCACGAAHY